MKAEAGMRFSLFQQPAFKNYLCPMSIELNEEWRKVTSELSERFRAELDLQGILFLIGVQELGKGFKSFSKQEKTELMHVAVCKLLESYGYYEYEGKDQDGWPHWRLNEKLPPLKPLQQEVLVKEAIVDYFKNNSLAN